MNLNDTVKQYDTLLDELFELLDRVEETDEGRTHRPVQIYCTREADRAKLNSVLFLLKHAREYRG